MYSHTEVQPITYMGVATRGSTLHVNPHDLHLNKQRTKANTSSEEVSQAHIQTRLQLPLNSTHTEHMEHLCSPSQVGVGGILSPELKEQLKARKSGYPKKQSLR